MKGKTVLLLILGIFILLFSGMAGIYNGLVRASESVNEAWSQVQNVYQRRLDLVPNLVETVKGYAEHERSTFLEVTEARAKVSQVTQNITPDALGDPDYLARFEAAQDAMGRALSRLLLIVERYPELKANENFLALQTQLEGTENRIAVERRRFNEAVRAYNVKTKQFPTNLVARAFNFLEKAYFRAREGAEETPSVKF